jgi:hypothetical protein
MKTADFVPRIWQNERMNRSTAILILFLAAILEAGGDALVRTGMRSSATGSRAAFFALGAAALFAYGWTVNAPLGLRECIGALCRILFRAHATKVLASLQPPPSRSVLIGGLLIVSGDLVIAVA